MRLARRCPLIWRVVKLNGLATGMLDLADSAGELRLALGKTDEAEAAAEAASWQRPDE